MAAVAEAATDDDVDVMDIFKMFDKDGNGNLTRDELKVVLKGLDGAIWTDESVDKLICAADTDGNGNIQMTEFWNWLNSENVTQSSVEELEEAAAEHKARRAAAAARQAAAREAKATAERRRHEQVQYKEARENFVRQRTAIGVSEKVAREMWAQADQDGNGNVDSQELRSYATYEMASANQIRGVFREGCAPEEGELSSSNVDDAAARELLKTFESWDEDGDGVISCEELQRVFRVLNPRLPQAAIDAMILEADSSQDGYVDITEFVDWLCGPPGKKRKKKAQQKDKEERQARLAVCLHQQQAAEARENGKQQGFEEERHEELQRFCENRKVKVACNTFHPGPNAPTSCGACGATHIWCCHNCGFISYFENCVNGCARGGVNGWTCVSKKCKGRSCGCRKPVSFWRRRGSTVDFARLSGTGARPETTAPPVRGGEAHGPMTENGEALATMAHGPVADSGGT